MTAITRAVNVFEGWRAGAKLILSGPGKTLACLVTTIESADGEQPSWYATYDSRKPPSFEKLDSVVEVLAPGVLLNTAMSRQERYERAWRTFDRFRRRGGRLSGWRDTYFERLTRSGPSNRIEDIITALRRWGTSPATALYAHVEGIQGQSLRTRGSPCLQYIQFGVQQRTLSITSLYRSHDFERKALGNMIGLARLVRFVALETNCKVGSVRCISLHAHCTKKANLQKLVA